MKQIRTAKELYNEILKSMYFGIYKKGDKLMTYQEVHEIYGLAKDTIGAAYMLLRNEGFVTTNRAKGTIVTFDLKNPEHVAKVPLEQPEHDEKREKLYQIIFMLHSRVIYTGITNLNYEQRLFCKKMAVKIVEGLEKDSLNYGNVFELWNCIISAMENKIFRNIASHLISRYMYFVPVSRLNISQIRNVRRLTKELYVYLQTALETGSFQEFSYRIEMYYNSYYQENAIVFSKFEEKTIFKEQALYGRLLHELSLKIFSKNLKKGDVLPTTARLCKEYNVSKTTVSRAYGILTELGLINRNTRSGTKLIAEPDDVDILANIDKFVGLQDGEWREIVEAFSLIQTSLVGYMDITSEILEQMRDELERQRKLFDQYITPFFVSDVLVSPLIHALPVGVIHKYYVYLTDILNRIMTLILCRFTAANEDGEEVYKFIVGAIEALEAGDKELFQRKGDVAIRKNAEFIVRGFAKSKNKN